MDSEKNLFIVGFGCCNNAGVNVMYAEVSGGSAAVRLPWGAVRERIAFPESIHVNVNNKPGAFVLQMIFAEFTVLAEKKIEQVLDSQVQQMSTHCARMPNVLWPAFSLGWDPRGLSSTSGTPQALALASESLGLEHLWPGPWPQTPLPLPQGALALM